MAERKADPRPSSQPRQQRMASTSSRRQKKERQRKANLLRTKPDILTPKINNKIKNAPLFGLFLTDELKSDLNA